MASCRSWTSSLRTNLVRSAAWVGRTIGAEELVLAAGLTLVTIGLWPVVGQAALVVPGVVLVWVALPQRTAFVQRTPAPPIAERQVR